MDIRISGHQMETGEALQSHATDRLTAVVGKYFDRSLSTNITFGKAPAGAFRCDIVTHAGHGLIAPQLWHVGAARNHANPNPPPPMILV